jgi:hypothetical protein
MQSVRKAIVQKLARMITGLHALETLLGEGLFQEQGIIQRALDEIDEDLMFLTVGVIYGEITPLHEQYLEYFYAEEFDNPSDVMAAHVSRGMVRREKVRAYITRQLGGDPRANLVGKILTKAYSGFVHAASPHIMDMCAGAPPRFDINRHFRELRIEQHADDALNYFYRALASMAFAAKAFGEEGLFSEMHANAAALEAQMQARNREAAKGSGRSLLG